MKPKEQRIAIAKACGWKKDDHYEDGFSHEGKQLVTGWRDNRNVFHRKLPDYLNDLNAMHETHESLTYEQHQQYCFELPQIVRRDEFTLGNNHKSVCHATAAQRAEAFLRTLNLWTD
jgi:hypothetical protein